MKTTVLPHGYMDLVDKRNQPVSLTSESAGDLMDEIAIKQSSWMCSDKTDGVRRWLELGEFQTIFHDRSGKTQLGVDIILKDDFTPALIDCELIEEDDRIVVFDIYAVSGRDLRGLPLKERHLIYSEVCKSMESGQFTIEAKEWLPANRFRELVDCEEGIIFQHNTRIDRVMKFKRINTIDLRCVDNKFPMAAKYGITIERNTDILEDGIYELAPTRNNTWMILQHRDDKIGANSDKTVLDGIAAQKAGTDIFRDYY